MSCRRILALIFAFCIVGQCNGAQVNPPVLETVNVAVKFSGLPAKFTVFHWQDNQGIFRSLEGEFYNFSFSEFRKCNLQPSRNDLLKSFLDLALDKKQASIVGQSNFHCATIKVDITYRQFYGKNGASRILTTTTEFLGVRPAFVFAESWSKNNVDSEIVQALEAELGKRNYKLLKMALEFSPIDSSAWVPKKCVVNVANISAGTHEQCNWKLPISFDDGIAPLTFSFLIDYHPNLSKHPEGLIDFGGFYGLYEISTRLIKNDVSEKQRKKKEPSRKLLELEKGSPKGSPIS